MTQLSSLSPQLRQFIEYTEERLGTEIVLNRQADSPACGILLDSYTYRTNKTVIAYPASFLGLLKDFVIGLNVVRLLMRGTAFCAGRYQVLSYDPDVVTRGMNQIYLDILKDEHTRLLAISRKKKLPFCLYKLFHDTLSDLPSAILAHVYLSVHFPQMRSAQVYFLIKESLRDMHELVGVKDFVPRRYFVMHNGMFYARDMLLAGILGENKLSPLLNIPELQRFQNLDMKEMMTHRWSQSHWYHAKIIGDAMHRMLIRTVPSPQSERWDPAAMMQIVDQGYIITNSYLELMQMRDWYLWESPEHLRNAEEQQVGIERYASSRIFSD
jgi:hypothetical protein